MPARMIPNLGPAPTKSHVAEPAMYQALAQLPDGFIVIHSLAYLAQAVRAVARRPLALGQADFLILHPELGFLVIEVKGGQIRYEHPTFVTSRGERIDPFSQLDRTVFAIPRWVRGAGGPVIQLGYALAFPEVLMHGQPLPPIVVDTTTYPAQNVVIDARDMRSLPARILAIMGYWKQALQTPSYTQAQIDAVVAALCPTMDYVLPWSERIRADTERWLALTLEQNRELALIRTQPRTVLNGRSGTGKTLLALLHARELDAAGQQVLFLLYNVLIAERVAGQLADTNVEVGTFHALCRRACRILGRPISTEDDWYHGQGPIALADALQQHKLIAPNGKPYTALIIDEGQAFRYVWLEFLLPPFRSGRILICCDDAQTLPLENFGCWAADIATMAGAPLRTLTVNVRSPRRVYERMEQVLPVQDVQTVSLRADEDDTLVEIVTPVPDEELARTLVELECNGVKPQDIAVLYSGTEPELAPIIRKAIGTLIPVGRFRGMEAPVVILYLPDEVGPTAFDRLTMMCAYGRATTRCIVIFALRHLLEPRFSWVFDWRSSPTDLRPLLTKLPAVQQAIASFCPIQTAWDMIPVWDATPSLFWVPFLGAWCMEEPCYSHASTYERLVVNLWTRHLMTTYPYPIALASLEETSYPHISWHLPGSSFLQRFEMPFQRLRWCRTCRRWTPRTLQPPQQKHLDACVWCQKVPMPCPDEAREVQAHAAILRTPSRFTLEEKRALSGFLIALGRAQRLIPNQRQLLHAAIDAGATHRYALAKILTCIHILETPLGTLIARDHLAGMFWEMIPWLHDRISESRWRTTLGTALQAWSKHGCLVPKGETHSYELVSSPKESTFGAAEEAG